MLNKKCPDLYDIKLYLRAAFFIVIAILYALGDNILMDFLFMKIWFFYVYQLFWLILMLEMAAAFIPKLNSYIACGKVFKMYYKHANYSVEKLKLDGKKANMRALIVALIWIIILVAIGVFKSYELIDDKFIIFISLFFFLSDQICINIWCPFKVFILKNKCCSTCRIFNWGHIMMFTPLFFIISFWTLSLAILSLGIFIYWEIVYFLYPERFSEISNIALRCDNCNIKCKWGNRD